MDALLLDVLLYLSDTAVCDANARHLSSSQLALQAGVNLVLLGRGAVCLAKQSLTSKLCWLCRDAFRACSRTIQHVKSMQTALQRHGGYGTNQKLYYFDQWLTARIA